MYLRLFPQKVTDIAWHPDEEGLLAVGSDSKYTSPKNVKTVSVEANFVQLQ